MDRRTFLSAAGCLPAASLIASANAEDTAEQEAEYTAGSGPGPVFAGRPVVSGPAADAITILQPLARHATGYLEFAVENGDWQRVDAAAAGLLPLEEFVLKFRLPPLPPGKRVRYRVSARSIGWVRVREFKIGKIVPGEIQSGPEHVFRTLDPAAAETKFVIWNDTHENSQTLQSLARLTDAASPDFLLWNGDQSNDIHAESKMAGQFLAPDGMAIANRWPLAYVRGNHDVRGPQARRLPQFTGTPYDRYYYAFRSGPVAALVMDTGEDKPDESVWLGGITDFAAMRRAQAVWLSSVTKEPWFREAPFKVLFCHIPLWFTRELPDADWGEYSKPCREAWLPLLVDAGVQVAISGHTHAYVWMPKTPEQPLGQLIGGGPHPKSATIIHGAATREKLSLKMSKLDGTVVAEAEVRA